MFYSIWLLAAALAGWVGGKIAGDDGFGTGADILFGLAGAFVVRWSLFCSGNCQNQAITVRRERHWTTAGDKPARELDRSTR
jgi:uncharacterized membrane protein YeaQ/YmgE (transglycosylase-associated protein family)